MSSGFFFNDTATTEIYTLSLHDALPISCLNKKFTLKELSYIYQLYAIIEIFNNHIGEIDVTVRDDLKYNLIKKDCEDRKSTRLNSSHANISYAVFCLKKKKRLY